MMVIQAAPAAYPFPLCRQEVREMSSDPSDPNPRLFSNRWANEAAANTVVRPLCHCLERKGKWSELKLHTEQQDPACPGWVRLLELIEAAANDNREEFSPGREMTP